MKKLGLTLILLLSWVVPSYSQSVCFLPSACGTTNFVGGTLTAPLFLPNGTAAAPSLAFTNSTNTGIFLPASGYISLSSLGVSGVGYVNPTLQLGASTALGWGSAGTWYGAAADTLLQRDAANTLALRNGGTAGTPVPQTFNLYSFCDGAACATGYSRAALRFIGTDVFLSAQAAGTGSAGALQFDGWGAIYFGAGLYPQTDDTRPFGTASARWTALYLSRSIQGSKSKALTDNTATAFVRLAVADDDYEGCGIVYTAFAEDTATDARQTLTGRTYAAILNNSGTEAVAFSTGDSAVLVTAGTFTCTFDGASAVADTIDLRATCDTSLAATTTLTFEYRLDCPSTVTVTPQ